MNVFCFDETESFSKFIGENYLVNANLFYTYSCLSPLLRSWISHPSFIIKDFFVHGNDVYNFNTILVKMNLQIFTEESLDNPESVVIGPAIPIGNNFSFEKNRLTVLYPQDKKRIKQALQQLLNGE